MSRGMLQALVRLPGDSEDAARPGKVEFLDNAVQNATGTVNLRATIPNADRHFWPGQFVNVRLVLDMEKGTVLVPSQTAQISQHGPFVFVVKSDDTAELRPVTLGQRQGNDVVISSGLAAGERVVLAGQLLVRPGSKVHVGSSAPATAPAPSRVRSSRHALCFPAEPTTVPPALRVPRPLARSRSPHRCLDADPK